jgi:hypothetical protein
MVDAGVSREGLATLWEAARSALPARSEAHGAGLIHRDVNAITGTPP